MKKLKISLFLHCLFISTISSAIVQKPDPTSKIMGSPIDRRGFQILFLSDGGIFKRYGLEVGDIIYSYDGVKIEEGLEALKMQQYLESSTESVEFDLVRNSKEAIFIGTQTLLFK